MKTTGELKFYFKKDGDLHSYLIRINNDSIKFDNDETNEHYTYTLTSKTNVYELKDAESNEKLYLSPDQHDNNILWARTNDGFGVITLN